MKAINIRIDHLKEPLGLQNERPLITWNADEGLKQTAFVFSILVNGEQKYGPEKIETSDMRFLSPLTFQDRDRVEVRIALFDENDEQGEETGTCFEMGIRSWEAKWIDPEPSHEKKRMPASYLRREFTVEKTGISRLYITAHGLYEASINGRRVGDFVLAPGTDDYNKRLQYQVYDVSDLLVKGNNRIQVMLGDGWYRGNNGIDGENHLFGDDLALLCQLEIDKEIVLISNEKWLASQLGPIRFADMEIGEIYNAEYETITGFHDVKVADFDKSVLVCSDEVPICEQEEFTGKLIRTPDGSIVYDFGQNLAGYCCFEVMAQKGQKITLRHGETLDEEGNFTQRNIDPGKRNKNGGIPQKIEYTCKDGLNVYKPKFSIFGFRYVKVETNVDLSAANFKAIAVYSKMAETASFECSDDSVNQLFRNSMWSMKSNFVDIPTDCPQRERSGWTGDAGVFVPTGVLLHDSYTVFRKWLIECRFAQYKNGKVANIAPPINKPGHGFTSFIDGSTGWGDAVIIVPYVLYKTYDDISILKENYPMMVKWLSYLRKLARKNSVSNLFRKDPYKKYVIDTGFHWGEWCQPDVDGAKELAANIRKAPKSATAYYCYSAGLLSEIAGILGKAKEAEEYAQLSRKIREAYIRTFTDDGIIESDRQCDYLRPVRFDLTDRKEDNVKALNEMIIRNGYHLNTGFLSTPFLCPILCEYGYTHTAYRLLLQEENPSWLYAVRKGATTIWESWNGIESAGNGSLNHYSYGAVSGWLIDGVCGIKVDCDTVTIRPYPNRLLKYARGSYQSPLGLIGSAWEYTDDGISFDITVPANLSATVILPDGKERILSYGKHHIELKGDF